MFVSSVQSATGNYVRPLARKAVSKLTAGKQLGDIKFNEVLKKSISEPQDLNSINKSKVRKATYETQMADICTGCEPYGGFVC